MSEFFDADDPDEAAEAADAPPRRHRRPRLLLGLVALLLLVIAISVFDSLWTAHLWYDSLGDSGVFTTVLGTKTGLFFGFGIVMALVVGGNLAIAFRLRPLYRPGSAEQVGLDRYRDVVTPMRRLILASTAVVVGVFAGGSSVGQWRAYLMWANRVRFGRSDPYFHKDIGFYVFSLPWWHYVVDFAMTAVIIALVGSLVVHYLYGGVRLQTGGDRFSRAAQAHVCVLLGILVLIKGLAYWLDRYDLVTRNGSLITGMTYARDHAVLPSQEILTAIAVICAVLFFANVWRHSWLLPGVGVALFAFSAVLLGIIWPAIVQHFQVRPNQQDKESAYVSQSLRATRAAYGLAHVTTEPITQAGSLTKQDVEADEPLLQNLGFLDPAVTAKTFNQLQRFHSFYSVPQVDVDRYQVNGTQRDLLIAPREVDVNGLPKAEQSWANLHTVYTHGYGVIAAYGDQRDADSNAQAKNGRPIWAEHGIPSTGVLSPYNPDIYFGMNSPEYSVVGHPKGSPNVELSTPHGTGTSARSGATEYHGSGGVPVGSLFHKALYAFKFGDSNILLSSRVNADSHILYDRSPTERVAKVAPWLTVDPDAVPAIVGGHVVWIVDGYTTTDRYPDSAKRSMEEMTSDAIDPRSTFATLPSDEVNYIRNSVKATVDAYTGKVTLYAWDPSDPILRAMMKAFPGTVLPRGDISPELLEHLRYPSDLFKVQRNIYATYHVHSASSFLSGVNNWTVPADPTNKKQRQAPNRFSVEAAPDEPAQFDLSTVYTARGGPLAAYLSVDSDAGELGYGRLAAKTITDPVVPSPIGITNLFKTNSVVTAATQSSQTGASATFGNLLTVPLSNGLLYVEPLYTASESGGYPVLYKVLVAFGNEQVGVGDTLDEALANMVTAPVKSGGKSSSAPSKGSGSGSTKGALPSKVVTLLREADRHFALAQRDLKKGHLTGYAHEIALAHQLVERALAAARTTGGKSPSASSSASPATPPATTTPQISPSSGGASPSVKSSPSAKAAR